MRTRRKSASAIEWKSLLAIWTTRAYEGETLPITGPEALSFAEVTAKIGAAIGRTLNFQAITDEEAKTAFPGFKTHKPYLRTAKQPA